MEKEYKIDSNIYSEKLIKKAIIDFREVSKIDFNKDKLNIIGDNEPEIEEIFLEFINYIISLYNEK